MIDGSPVIFVRLYPYLESMVQFSEIYLMHLKIFRREGKTPLEPREYLIQQWAFWRQLGTRPVEYCVIKADAGSSVRDSIDIYAEIEIPEKDGEDLTKLITKAQDILENHWHNEELKSEFYRNECAPVLFRIARFRLNDYSTSL